jgi:hypothetical protein
MFIPGFLVPIFVSAALAVIFLWDTLPKDEEGFPQLKGAAVWILAGALFLAFLGFRRFVPIPRGGFFWQSFVLFVAFLFGAGVADSVNGVLGGLVCLTLLVGLHLARLAVEMWWFTRSHRTAQ